MDRFAVLAVLVSVCCGPAWSQSPNLPLDPSLPSYLSFERDQSGALPAGWRGGPTATLSIDDTDVHAGKHAVRIDRTATDEGSSSSLTASLPIDFDGRRIELRGFIRTENVSDFAGLWLREDGNEPTLALENMQRQQLKGTTPWREYSIALPVHRDARTLVFGFLVVGTGKAWVDDLQLFVDGKPIWEAPKAVRQLTALDRDHEFDESSKIALRDVTPLQVRNLATLGRVWGFLKYHHPRITTGELQWDYELFRIMPAVVEAESALAANKVLSAWVEKLGPLNAANNVLSAWVEKLGPLKAGPNSLLTGDVHLRPDLAWIDEPMISLPPQRLEVTMACELFFLNQLRDASHFKSARLRCGHIDNINLR